MSSYSYEAKYIDRNGAELVIPADIQEDLKERIRSTA
jgi:D-alanine-D-alanine ligase-like ATP-grasp enzyme